jgi:hypothetical protein
MVVLSQQGVGWGKMPRLRFGHRDKGVRLVHEPALRQFILGVATRKRNAAHVLPQRSNEVKAIKARARFAQLGAFWKTVKSEVQRLYAAKRRGQALAPVAPGLRRPAQRGAARRGVTVEFHPAGKRNATRQLQRFPRGFAIAEVSGYDRRFIVIDQRGTTALSRGRLLRDLVVVDASDAWST